MTVISPRYFGFEGEFYWDLNNALFPVDPVTEQVTDLQVTNWLTSAEKSAEVITVGFSGTPMTMDITTRPTAFRGFSRTLNTVTAVQLTFGIHHNRTTDKLVQTLISSAFNVSEMPLAIFDNDSGKKQGIIGNFNIHGTKSEPVSGIQSWDFTATPNSYIDYWIEP